MADYNVISIEDVFNSKAHLDGDSLITSINMDVLEETFNTKAQTFERDGLGLWKGMAMELKSGNKVVLVTDEKSTWGAIAWLEKHGEAGATEAIAFLNKHIPEPEKALYAHGTTGTKYPRPA